VGAIPIRGDESPHDHRKVPISRDVVLFEDDLRPDDASRIRGNVSRVPTDGVRARQCSQRAFAQSGLARD
jgi:hypothetical protein